MQANPWSLFRLVARRQVSADADPLPDAELLRRFATTHDPAAFELLVWRHGAMVLGTCRRILRDEHAAEDAFQATFLVLARKAGSVRTDGSATGWLHRVARRVAVRATKRIRREEPLAGDPTGRPLRGDVELRAILDAEIDRLPDRFRLPVVLCYLDGRTTEDAAALLGVPRGTVLSRLATARQKLADRLTRRGITVPAGGAFAAGLTAETVSAELVESSLRAAVSFAAGLGGASPAIELAEGVLRMGTRIKLGAWVAALIAVAGFGTSVGVVAGNAPQPAAQAKAGARPTDPPKPADDDQDLIKQAREKERAEREQREVERVERMKKLEQQSRVLDAEVSSRLDTVRALQREAASNVDAKALEAALAKADELILKLEDQIVDLSVNREVQQKQLADLPAYKPTADDLEGTIQSTPDVRAVTQELHKARSNLERLRRNSSTDNQALQAALLEEKSKADQLAEARRHALPTAEKKVRESFLNLQRQRVAEAKARVEIEEKSLRTAIAKRAQLAERYAKAKQAADRVQLVEDELKVFREVRQEVLRQKLRLEIGLDEPKR